MPSIREQLQDPTKKEQIVDDCVVVLDAEVKDKGGLSGVAIKAGYKIVKDFKPGFVRNVITDLLPEFGDAVEPIYEEAKASGKDVAQHFQAKKSDVAEGLLAITDAKAARSKNAIIKKTYDKLRKKAKEHVEVAAPRVGELIAKHMP